MKDNDKQRMKMTGLQIIRKLDYKQQGIRGRLISSIHHSRDQLNPALTPLKLAAEPYGQLGASNFLTSIQPYEHLTSIRCIVIIKTNIYTNETCPHVQQKIKTFSKLKILTFLVCEELLT